MSSDTSRRDHAAMAVREVLAGDRKVGTVSRSARRRRLELRRLGRTASAVAEDDAAKRVRPASDSSSDSSESAKVAPEPTAEVARWPACVSHGAVSVIGRRREMEDAIFVAAPFLAAAKEAAVEGSGVAEEEGKEEEEDEGFFAVYDGHGGSRVAEACRERMHVVLAEEVRLRRLLQGGGGGADVEDEDRARWKEAMAACFARVDGEVGGAEEADTGEQTVGSTAVVAVVGPRRIVVANCGDSRAVLSRGGVAVPLSSDHKVHTPRHATPRHAPTRSPHRLTKHIAKKACINGMITPPPKFRGVQPATANPAANQGRVDVVVKAPRFRAFREIFFSLARAGPGGLRTGAALAARSPRVAYNNNNHLCFSCVRAVSKRPRWLAYSSFLPDRPDEMERVEAAGGRVINWNGYRILGVLATSRSIGDYYLKPYVIAEPEVTVMDRTDKDEFLILASDGLWDVVSNDGACKIARNCLSGRAASKYPESVSGSTAADAAALLVELAISRGSKDNISVVVVELRRLKSKDDGEQRER
uniref:protein-serine/threonine phosphatase n=1 Tax=Oryza meridionalis TaxID=40149 RepID=A0A0E0C5I5_9ORYZ